MQFVKRVARFVHLQPFAINRRLAATRMSYAPDADARSHAPGDASAATCNLPQQAEQRKSDVERERETYESGSGAGQRPDERPCWQFFIHLTIEATTTTTTPRTLPCPVLARFIHPSIHSTAQRLVRCLIHALRHSFIHSFTH